MEDTSHLIKKLGVAENNTIDLQQQRGRGQTNPYGDDTFAAANKITLDLTYLFDAPNDPQPISKADLVAVEAELQKAHRQLINHEGDICDNNIPMTGWLTIADQLSREKTHAIKQQVASLRDAIDAYISIGIGGSYLGIEAVVRALTHTHFNRLSRQERGGCPEIYFMGQNLDPDYLRDTLDLLRGKRVAIHVISKSGTTTETALVFRLLSNLLKENYSADASRYIWVTTDEKQGALRKFADQQGLQTFVVPDNIGGRFSILSDVGLVGIAMAGIDIDEFAAGFSAMKRRTDTEDFWQNPAMVHAAARLAAWKHGKKIEVVATNATNLYDVARFMEQLFPESEGHHGRGMWVSPTQLSEKLHANGQMIQQGERNFLETFLILGRPNNALPLPSAPDDFDGFNFLSQRNCKFDEINQLIVDGTAYAHFMGGVPNMTIHIPQRNAYCIGQLLFMFERSVALSGIAMGHNPFIQPGVVAYKNAMFALAGKPGHEKQREEILHAQKQREKVIVE